MRKERPGQEEVLAMVLKERVEGGRREQLELENTGRTAKEGETSSTLHFETVLEPSL